MISNSFKGFAKHAPTTTVVTMARNARKRKPSAWRTEVINYLDHILQERMQHQGMDDAALRHALATQLNFQQLQITFE